jgi:hypothetical protein
MVVTVINEVNIGAKRVRRRLKYIQVAGDKLYLLYQNVNLPYSLLYHMELYSVHLVYRHTWNRGTLCVPAVCSRI